jgi:hypothetical protein
MKFGWIKLHRKILDSRVFANEGLFRLWIYCLCRANHETNYVQIQTGKGNTEVEVNAGEFIFGRKSVSRELGMNPSTLYKRMQKLEMIGNINMQSNSHYSIVSICNWEVYQDSDFKKEQAKEQASNTQVTGKEQASNTEKNDKNDKNVKNDEKKEDDKSSNIPSLSEVRNYFDENGYDPNVGEKAFKIYNASLEDNPKRRYWRDSRDNLIKNWKMKMRSVWFKPENVKGNNKQNSFNNGNHKTRTKGDDHVAFLTRNER